MPEGHTIHRLAARHRELFAGDRLWAASPQGRFADGAARLSGRVMRDAEAYGKHLLHHYEGDLSLHVHLGLYGRFNDGPVPAPPPVGQVRLRLEGSRHFLDLRGPAACELFDPAQVAALRDRLGADPLRDDADPSRPYRRISRSPAPLASLLLDQSVVAGTGLIYVTEVLFRAGLPPTLPGRELTPAAWEALWHHKLRAPVLRIVNEFDKLLGRKFIRQPLHSLTASGSHLRDLRHRERTQHREAAHEAESTTAPASDQPCLLT